MRKIFLLTACMFFISCFVNAQYRFQRMYGGVRNERGQGLFSTYDNGYIFNGATTSYGAGDADAILVKTDAQGNFLWSKAYGTVAYDNSEFAIQTFDHNIVCTGRTFVTAGNATIDALLYKTDSIGNLLWGKIYGGVANEGANKVIETFDHGYAIVGSSSSYGAGNYDIFLIRTDENGDTLFTKTYGTAEVELGTSVAQTSDGGFILSGRNQYHFGSLLTADGVLIRTDAMGNLLWTKTYGDTLWEELQMVKQTPDGGFIVTGSTISWGEGDYDILLMKTDTLGNVEWGKTYGGTKPDASYAVTINPDNSYVMSGYTNSLGYGHTLRQSFPNHIMGDDSTNIFLLKTDANGDTIWTRSYGDGLIDEGYLSDRAADGGYLISGFTTDYLLTDSTQMLFIKTDTLGYTGCHEQDAHPAVHTIPIVGTDVTFDVASGIPYSAIALVQTNTVTNDDDACLFSQANSLHHEKYFDVFPNPTEGKLAISNWQWANVSIELYNVLGEKVFSKTKSEINNPKTCPTSGGSEITLDIGELPQGIYFLHLADGFENRVTKIIKL